MPTTSRKPLIGCGRVNDNGRAIFKVESDTRPGHFHVVTYQPATGRVHCSCESFRKSYADKLPTIRSNDVCKHVGTHRVAIVMRAHLVAAVSKGDNFAYEIHYTLHNEPFDISFAPYLGVACFEGDALSRISHVEERLGMKAVIVNMTGAEFGGGR